LRLLFFSQRISLIWFRAFISFLLIKRQTWNYWQKAESLTRNAYVTIEFRKFLHHCMRQYLREPQRLFSVTYCAAYLRSKQILSNTLFRRVVLNKDVQHKLHRTKFIFDVLPDHNFRTQQFIICNKAYNIHTTLQRVGI
jgi:hypothetical protein